MDKSFHPMVSIVIPVYNGSNYLKESINAAISQTYDNKEIIVVNDGSSDAGETEKIALSFGEKIRYIKKENGGVSSALNMGIKEMHGSYFSWLSHDDLYSDRKLQDAVEMLGMIDRDERDHIIAYTNGYYINSQGERLKNFEENFETNKIYKGNDVIFEMLSNGILDGCAMLIPKGAFDLCGMFDETLRYNQDAMMWYKMFSQGYSLICDNNQNVMYRLHRNQTSKLRRDLFIHDSIQSSHELIPLFSKISTAEKNMLFIYGLRMAKNDCPMVVDDVISYGKKEGLINTEQARKLKMRLIYGKCRTTARNIRNKLMK